MPVVVATTNIIAGLLLLAVAGTLAVDLAAPRKWLVAAFVVLDTGLLTSGLFALPIALLSGSH